MCLLYRVEDEIAIEMSRNAWEHIQESVGNYLADCDGLSGTPLGSELVCFQNSVRAHIQHLDAEARARKPTPAADNTDLA